MLSAEAVPVDLDREYSKTIDFLYSFERFGILLGLENISSLLAAIGNPQLQFRSVHVAGSNGKGSTSAFIEAMAWRSGMKTALYTSPHLNDFRERIRINGKFVSKQDIIRATRDILPVYDHDRTTFFEYTTAIAFDCIARAKPDLAIIEVGLGGRLDATNTVKPVLSVITDISREHEDYLGTGIRAVATEKAGVIKEKTPVITGATRREAREVILARAAELDSPVYEFGREFQGKRTSLTTFDYRSSGMFLPGLRLGMSGAHQIKNASLALRAAEELIRKGFRISLKSMILAIEKTLFPGRMEKLRSNPHVIIDGAHTPEGMRLLKSSLMKLCPNRKMYLMLGILKDKNVDTLVQSIVPIAEKVMCVAPHSDRSLEPEILAQKVRKMGVTAITAGSIEEGFRRLELEAGKDDVVVAAGSLYMIGPVRRACGKSDE